MEQDTQFKWSPFDCHSSTCDLDNGVVLSISFPMRVWGVYRITKYGQRVDGGAEFRPSPDTFKRTVEDTYKRLQKEGKV